MIKPIGKDDLFNCLKIFHQGYETVAIEFGLTEENCPDRWRASLSYEHKAPSHPYSNFWVYLPL
jgi:hypothetical protein